MCYIINEDELNTIYLALCLEKPLLVSGPAGVGKTELAKVLSDVLGAGVGLCYYIFFVVISLFFSPGSLSVIALGFKGLYTLLVSAAGGICGLAFA
jgi:hypothetical protein